MKNNKTASAKACIPSRRTVAADHRKPRVLVQVFIMSLAGALVYFVFGHRLVAAAIWFLACLLLCGFLFSPTVVKGFDRFGAWLGQFVGTAMTYVLLVPMFYIVFTFGRIVIIVLGRDPLQRKWRPEATSYWSDRPSRVDETHFKRQY